MNTIKYVGIIISAILALMIHSVHAQDHGQGPLDLRVENGRLLLIFPETLMDRKILVVNRVAKGSAPTGGAEESILAKATDLNKKAIQFRRALDGGIELLEALPPTRKAATDSPVQIALDAMNQLPILAKMPIIPGTSPENIQIDVTDLFLQDIGVFGISDANKKRYRLGAYLPKNSTFIKKEQFDRGLDVQFLRSYTEADQVKSFVVNTTILVLEKTPMTGRLADNRVTAMGFNTNTYLDLSIFPYSGEDRHLAYRYRIDPLPEDYAAYKQGHLVDPIKPIIFYLDPATPSALIPYFEKAILSWNAPFEQAGFKNVIQIGRIPNRDTSFNFVSARYNALDYGPSAGYGGNADVLLDPESGEIISSRIYWPHGNGRYLYNQYLVQASAVDSDVKRGKPDDDLIGALSAAVVAHEMGHCLGLHHNYLSSALIPVKNLRNKEWVEKNGISPSVMDYSRHNYVAQPGDGISREGLIPKVGAYDHWAVEWLYTWFTDRDLHLEKRKLDSLYDLRIAENPTIAYLNIDHYRDDRRLQMEDVGDDPLLASAYGIENLKRVMPQLLDWTEISPGMYDIEMAIGIFMQSQAHFLHLLTHVTSLIGGQYMDFTMTQAAFKTGWVARQTQKEAVRFLVRNIFETPAWFVSEDFARLKPQYGNPTRYRLNPRDYVVVMQESLLSELLRTDVFLKIQRMELEDADPFSIRELFQELHRGIFSELDRRNTPITLERMILQQTYLQKLQQMALASSKQRMLVRVPSVIRTELTALHEKIQQQVAATPPIQTEKRDYLHDLAKRISQMISDLNTL